jgi:hypothetical protein
VFFPGTEESFMNKRSGQLVCLMAALIAGPTASTGQTQNGPPDHPSVTIGGQTFSPRSILTRNIETPEDQTTQFPPHKIEGTVYPFIDPAGCNIKTDVEEAISSRSRSKVPTKGGFHATRASHADENQFR